MQDAAGEPLGLLMRTSPRTDSRMGYQGPTDGLLALDATGETVLGIGIKRSFDTPQYVEDVTLDWTFMHRFDGLSLAEFTRETVGAGGTVEGVSGATMTSQTLVANLIDAGERLRQIRHQAAARETELRVEPWWAALQPDWQWRDLGTVAIVFGAMLMAFTNLRGRTSIRRGWQLVLMIGLGLMNADLLSQSLLVGWARSGPAWRHAAGLCVLAGASLLIPLTTKTQLYCHHLCPHGAAQELLRGRLRWQWHLPTKLRTLLSYLPGVLLLTVLGTALWRWPVSLGDLEPFDAWSLGIAGGITFAIAVGGLISSMFVPMAYCRFGCPTGALLGYLRRNARSDQLTARDGLALAAALLAAAVAWW